MREARAAPVPEETCCHVRTTGCEDCSSCPEKRRPIVKGITYPSPSTGVGISLHKDVLARGTSRPDAVDGSLVELCNEGVVHVMVLIVGVEDNLAVTREPGGNGLPVRLETVGVGDHVSIVTPKVLRVDDSVCAFACDVADDLWAH